MADSISIPTPAQPIDEKGNLVAQVWWRFFQGLLNRTAATIPYLVGMGSTAAGTVQADALALQSEWNEITTVALNSGVLLNAFGAGFDSRVWNKGINALKIYPPVGCQIDALGVNNPYSLAAAKAQVFSQLSATQWQSLQLG